MNIEEQLHNKEAMLLYVKSIAQDTKSIKKLIKYTYDKTSKDTSRGAWALAHIDQINSGILSDYHVIMIQCIEKSTNEGLIRNTLKIFEHKRLKGIVEDTLVDICFRYLSEYHWSVAIKVYAMTILYHASLTYPELEKELQDLIENQMPYSSKAFQSRGNKILNKIKK